jgi:multiple sugar transport system permease protein
MKYYPDSDVSYGGALNESIRLAGTLLSIAPLLVIYLFLQNHFVQSIERTGIAGE